MTKKPNLGRYIQITCLPSFDYSYPGINVVTYAVGMGLTSQDGNMPLDLMNTKLTIYDSSLCFYMGPKTDWSLHRKLL